MFWRTPKRNRQLFLAAAKDGAPKILRTFKTPDCEVLALRCARIVPLRLIGCVVLGLTSTCADKLCNELIRIKNRAGDFTRETTFVDTLGLIIGVSGCLKRVFACSYDRGNDEQWGYVW